MTVDTAPDKRTRLVDAAVRLVHVQGYARTTLADIAEAADVPLGNVYYYFKSKEAIGEALVGRRSAEYRAACDAWNGLADPKARLKAFVRMTQQQREVLASHGCPVGTLCAELAKEEGPLSQRAAGIFGELLTWLEQQFTALGQGREAKDSANHVMSALQGAALLAHAFSDTQPLEREARRLLRWIDQL